MKKVIVYVEGPSDVAAMRTLLASLLEEKRRGGVAIEFFGGHRGDAKKAVLTKVPRTAANVILNDPTTVVVAMPDLYPRNKAFPHETVEELRSGIRRNFESALKKKGAADDVRLRERFRVFCFKHDLEALLLASKGALAGRLGAADLKETWKVPVEDQDHDAPPKKIVETLFRDHGKRYKAAVDAPLILKRARVDAGVDAVADKCTQCFKPFLEFLRAQ